MGTGQLHTNISNKTLAEVIHSSAVTLEINTRLRRRGISRDMNRMLPKLVSFNLKSENDIIVISDNEIFDIDKEEIIAGRENVLHFVEERLNKVMKNSELEFIRQDNITKSVIVFTTDYIDKLVKGEEYLGQLALNYYHQWYTSKCGGGRHNTEKHHEQFKTFSQKEIDYLKHKYIPIAVVPKDIKPIYDTIVDSITLSPVIDFIETDIGYNVTGQRVEGTKMFWIPRIVAKEYLEENDDFKVLSSRVLHKILTEAGLMGKPPVLNRRVISKDMFSSRNIGEATNSFILERSKEKRVKLSSEGTTVRQLINYDIDRQDNLIPEGAGEISLDY